MGEKLTKLKHLRTALLKTKEQIAGMASAAADAIDEVAANAVTIEQIKEAFEEVITDLATKPLDPVDVYQNTRPADWLPMPEPVDDEMYMLFHIPDGVSALLAFTATCSGNYTVELGTVVTGEFVPSASTNVVSGSRYEAELSANDYGNLTASGMKQVMIKVSGENILTWEPSVHSKKSSAASSAQNIVEIKCRLSKSTAIKVGVASDKSLRALRYYTQYGPNTITNMESMFRECTALIAIPQLDTAGATSMKNMFSNCAALIAIPQLDTGNVRSMYSMFSSCPSLTTIPQLNTAGVTDMNSMFARCFALTTTPQLNTANVTDMGSMFLNCTALRTIPQMDTGNVKSMYSMFSSCTALSTIPRLNTGNVKSISYMFSSCSSLTAIPQLNTAGVTYLDGMFNNCDLLSKITLDPNLSGWSGGSISLRNCSLGHSAIVAFFNSLPTITAAHTITLTGNPGVAELTENEKAIATNKNWTLTL